MNELTVTTAVRTDRSVGAVLGSAAGDALGAHYEFGPPLAADVDVAMIGGGHFGWEPGEWTDDTQMALAVLTVLADPDRAAGDPAAAIEDGFRRWFANQPRDVGFQTRSVLGGAGAPGSMHASAAAFTASRPNGAAGNGSLMRTGPIALAHPGDREAIAALARSVSALTHPDPDCVAACVLWSVAIDRLIHDAPPSEEPVDFAAVVAHGLDLLPANERGRWRDLIAEAAAARPADVANNGWVVAAFQAALAAITSTPVPPGHHACSHLELTLANAVRAGGDTDTVAAIAGSLLGARWGATAVPLAWRRLLHGSRVSAEDVLGAEDLDHLARRAANGGRPDSAGWPGVRTMVPTYRTQFVRAARPRSAIFDGVAFGNAAAIAAAVDDGADVIFSLCRLGADDVPVGVEHHTLGLLDTSSADNPNAVFVLTDLADALAALVQEGRRPFVHCVAAENRTPAAAAAYLVRHSGQPAATALDRVRTDLGGPNQQFLIDAIHALEKTCQ